MKMMFGLSTAAFVSVANNEAGDARMIAAAARSPLRRLGVMVVSSKCRAGKVLSAAGDLCRRGATMLGTPVNEKTIRLPPRARRPQSGRLPKLTHSCGERHSCDFVGISLNSQ
jgi:hypothetical protein